ncbi:MAG: hypothetical protein HOC20_14015 [Chloroflexi bacterium]|nr:hypothetical protein [Chloroflexota bacterium]
MTGAYDTYIGAMEPILTLAASFTEPAKGAAARSFLQNPCQVMPNFAKQIPAGYLEMGMTLNRMSRRKVQQNLNRALRKNNDDFREKAELFAAIVEFLAAMGSAGHTLHEADEIFESMIDENHDRITNSLNNEYGPIISCRTYVGDGEVGASLMGFIWEKFAGNAEARLTPTITRVLALDEKDVLKTCYRLIWLSQNLDSEEVKEGAESLFRTWLEEHYGVNTNNVKKTSADPEIDRQGDPNSEAMFEEEETKLDIELTIKEILRDKKPRLRQLIRLHSSYKNKEIKKDEYEEKLLEIGYSPSAARQAVSQLRKNHPELRERLTAK